MIKKIGIILLFQVVVSSLWAIHPRIYVSDSDRVAIKQKISDQTWAKEAFERIKHKIDPYVERHQ